MLNLLVKNVKKIKYTNTCKYFLKIWFYVYYKYKINMHGTQTYIMETQSSILDAINRD